MNHRGEHTWGLAGGHCKGLSFNSTHEQLLGSSNLTCVRTWQEQRQFIQNAIEALVHLPFQEWLRTSVTSSSIFFSMVLLVVFASCSSSVFVMFFPE